MPARAATSVIGSRVAARAMSRSDGNAVFVVTERGPPCRAARRHDRCPVCGGYARPVVVGVGIDVVDIARFEQILARRPGLADRLFTSSERGLSAASLAARFAAKEAVAKALGAPAGLAWHDCEVVTAGTGRPSLVLRGTVA